MIGPFGMGGFNCTKWSLRKVVWGFWRTMAERKRDNQNWTEYQEGANEGMDDVLAFLEAYYGLGFSGVKTVLKWTGGKLLDD